MPRRSVVPMASVTITWVARGRSWSEWSLSSRENGLAGLARVVVGEQARADRGMTVVWLS
ncbi:hypothetical protein G6O69_11065 [Pseudenhygromyxa sp. WMMC2535]|uniref:hypothetical protein n=1 Tax=Pseudenhygromyxa sp. WMMC2535 TaxID=2712867 RepID=UPI001594E99A|nr:hypothetical protein [Pseudenhygromyxa sp. WMMC2535]NVB38371.1 hypothetical protein [Pseudenhygromyxa sp. WMMC2535]